MLHDFFDENIGPENHLDQQDSNLDSTHKHITIINVTKMLNSWIYTEKRYPISNKCESDVQLSCTRGS